MEQSTNFSIIACPARPPVFAGGGEQGFDPLPGQGASALASPRPMADGGRMDASVRQGRDWTGLGLALVAVTIWAAWLPATRIAIEDGLTGTDIALLRYGVPATMLAPLCWRIGLLPRGVPLSSVAMMFCWGAPFVLFVTAGMDRASIAHTAALVPCTMPVLAAAGAWLLHGERIAPERRAGIALIAVAAALVLALVLSGRGGETDLPSLGFLLLASAGWAAYTVAYRRSGLSAVQAAAVVFAWSTLLLVPVILATGSALPGLPPATLAFHIAAQGILSGFVATIAYGLAITRLGTARAASFSVLVPVLATAMAVVWLGERPSVLDAVALGIGTLGVAMVNGALSPRR